VLLALLAGVMAVGLASAQTETPEPSVTDAPERLGDRFKEELASQLGISVDELNTALDNTQYALIDEAVADGKLTESEAERLRERVEEGHNLFPLHGIREHIGHRAKVELVEATAEVLGVDVSVVREGLGEGKSLATIANENGMDTEAFKTALLENIKATLDEKVATDDLTQEQADRLYGHFSENIDRIVNNEPGEFRPPFRHPPRGPRFFDAPNFDDDSDSESDEEDTSATTF
jgi:polyhydroxyalkanoate synthesis regulator phasin